MSDEWQGLEEIKKNNKIKSFFKELRKPLSAVLPCSAV